MVREPEVVFWCAAPFVGAGTAGGGWSGWAMAQPLVPWCRPGAARRTRLMALALVRMSIRMRALSAAPGFLAAPGAVGEVVDLAFHDGTTGAVSLLPGRPDLAHIAGSGMAVVC